MGVEPLKKEENPFASPREVANEETPTRPRSEKRMSGPTVLVFTILSVISALIAFRTSCSMFNPRPQWMLQSLPNWLEVWSPVIAIFSGLGMAYGLRWLAKRVRTQAERWDRESSSNLKPAPASSSFHFFGLLGVFGAIVVSIFFVPLAMFESKFRDFLLMVSYYGFLLISVGGVLAAIVSVLHRLLR